MIDAPLALAFASGMVAAFNPCGFAMLPAYLSYFLGLESPTDDGDLRRAPPLRAIGVGAVVSGGFVAVFGVAGGLFSWFSVSLSEYAEWVTIGLGLLLVAAGVALVAGWQPTFALPKLDRGGRSQGLGSMFVFGVSYAVASLGCTLPVFLANVVNTFERTNVASGVVVFFTYSLGMALVLMVVTLALALARHGLVQRMRRGVRYVSRVSGVLLMVSGAYVAYYAWYLLRTTRGDTSPDAIGDQTTAWSFDLTRWVQDTGPVRIGLVLGAVVVAAVLASLLRSGSGPADEPVPERVEEEVAAAPR